MPKDCTGPLTGWDIPCRAEPTRQEQALLSNHDGAAAPGPARLCNDLKQEGRPQAPTPVRGGTKPGTWNLEPGTSQFLNLTSTRLDSTRLDPTTDPLPSTLTSYPSPLRLRDANTGPDASWPCPRPSLPRWHTRAMFPIHQKPKNRLLLCCYYYCAATPNITTTRWDMVKCGLGLAVPNTVIDRQSAPPFDARAWTAAWDPSMFAHGCPCRKSSRLTARPTRLLLPSSILLAI